jgi:5'-nucleotidase
LRILITNDDGVDAPGIDVMRTIAAAISDDVWVVAPDGNQSGAGHRFTFGRELELIPRGDRIFAVAGGTPADCVVAGCTHVLGGTPPDLVLSGVNNGQNLGDIIHCSGTAAGAREGTLQGSVGIAMSQGVDFENGIAVAWDNALRFGAEVVRGILAGHDGRDTFYNVNFPYCPTDEVEGVRVAGAQRFSRSPMRYYPSENAGKFFIAIPETPQPLDPEHDFHILHHQRAVTVTPMSLRLMDEAVALRLRGAFAEEGGPGR